MSLPGEAIDLPENYCLPERSNRFSVPHRLNHHSVLWESAISLALAPYDELKRKLVQIPENYRLNIYLGLLSIYLDFISTCLDKNK
jgi:hypothetical protein